MASILQRAKARYRLWKRVGIWYHAEYATRPTRHVGTLPNVDLVRGRRVLDALAHEKLLRANDVRPAPLASLADLSAVHEAIYLEALNQAEVVAPVFGLEGHLIDVDRILRAQRRAVGGTVAAARWASRDPDRVAFNLGGGFHHAFAARGGGFCLLNDLAIAVGLLRRQGFTAPIAILDLDFHQGDGTRSIFAEDTSVLTCSLHGSVWSETPAVTDVQRLLPAGTDDGRYLSALSESFLDPIRAHRPKLILYIAGTDVLERDRLGTFAVSPNGVMLREQWVVDLARSLDSSLVVTLGGGYSPRAWQSSANFLRWLLTNETGPFAKTSVDLRMRYKQVAESLDPHDLQRDTDDWSFTEEDLLGDLVGQVRPQRRLLGYYSAHGVELALERYGLTDKLRAKGFTDHRLEVDPSQRDRQRITVHGRKGSGPFHLLVDLVVRKRTIFAREYPLLDSDLELISIEWMQLQDPTRRFSERLPQLPGQAHPGLGMVRDVMGLLYQACLRLKQDGIVIHPSRYHIAAVAAANCLFLDPRVQGRFEAMREIFAQKTLPAASRALDQGEVRTKSGETLRWDPADFVAPAQPHLTRYFEAGPYQRARTAAYRELMNSGVRMHVVN